MQQNSKAASILLESKRLYLRRVEKGDINLFKQLFCDPKMMHFLGGSWTKDLATETLLEWRREWGKNNYYYGVLVKKETSEAIGIAGFTENTIPEEVGLEFAWFIVPEQQQKGYATEITQEILAYAFDDIKIDRVLAETHPSNIAATRVLEKSSFTNIGERTNKYDYLPGFEKQVLWECKRLNWRGKRTEKENTVSEYKPSPRQWVAEQVELYEESDETEGLTFLDTGLPVIIVTHRGRKTGAIRKTPLMRVADGKNYILVASQGGAPENPLWYHNLEADPNVTIRDKSEAYEI